MTGDGDKTLLEVANLIRNDDSLYNLMLEELDAKALSTGFVNKLRVLSQKSGNHLLKVKLFFIYRMDSSWSNHVK